MVEVLVESISISFIDQLEGVSVDFFLGTLFHHVPDHSLANLAAVVLKLLLSKEVSELFVLLPDACSHLTLLYYIIWQNEAFLGLLLQ